MAGGGAVPVERISSLKVRNIAIVPGTSVSNGVVMAKAEDRLRAAVSLYETGLVRKIVVSGAEDEVTPMTQYLMKKEIPAQTLSTDGNAVDTYETIARVKEKFGDTTFFFCTQEMYANRAGWLMKRLGMDGVVVSVDTMHYSKTGKNRLREFFAATKAVFEPFFRFGKAKVSIEEKGFTIVEEPIENPHFIREEDIETPKDMKTFDANPEDDYDVVKAVSYARKYAFERNSSYGQFEENCTNFVSQCLAEGGITMEGKPVVSEKKRLTVSGEKTEWFSGSEKCESDELMHYHASETFIRTHAFISYFTEQRGYSLSLYENDMTGKEQCYEEANAGDVMVLYDKEGAIVHLGLISGIGEGNVYYCGNTANRRDFSVFTINSETYSKIGILHMSQKNK